MNLNFLNSIDSEKSSLIDYANLISNLLLPQKKFSDKKNLNFFFQDYSKGIPILLPYDLKCFNYYDDKYFLLHIQDIVKGIFSLDNKQYVGIQRFILNGLKFIQNGKPKNKYNEFINKINFYNETQKNKIKKLSGKGYSVVAFQTRNFPHLGHEAIINYLLSKVDYVVVNPLIGPKKRGDAKNELLVESYNFLIEKKFNNKVYILPIIANMFYAGPREACHHAIIRKNIGFTHFCVGRDHAGAENIYDVNLASRITKKLESKLKINIIKTGGAFFCLKCKKSIVKDECNHSEQYLRDISGNNFREELINNRYYEYADIELQDFLRKKNKKLFQD